jgi:hypothetical protein
MRPSTYRLFGQSQYKLFAPLWTSTDQATTFAAPVNLAAVSTPEAGAPALIAVGPDDEMDKPWVSVDPANGNVFYLVNWSRVGSGNSTIFFRSLNGGSTWTHKELADPGGVAAPNMAIGNNLVYFVYTTGTSIKFRKSTLHGASFNPAVTVTSSLFAQFLRYQLLRNSYDSYATDVFDAAILPLPAVNPAYSQHVYLVFHNKASASSSDVDIYLAYSTDGGVTWPANNIVRVNDVVAGDQWQPTITVKPDGSKLFIGWYDRKHDSVRNHRIKMRGLVSSITAQSPLNSVTYFDITSEDFAPVFTGTKEVDGTFDPVYGAPKSSIIFNHPTCGTLDIVERCGAHIRQNGDYDQSTSDNTYIYYSWGDNHVRRNGRLQTDARFRRIAW